MLSGFLMLQPLLGETKEGIYIKNAARTAGKEHKVLVVEFWDSSCNPCMALKRDIFDNTMQSGFVDRYFRMMQLSPADSMYMPLVNYFHLQYQSSVIYIDRDGNEIDRTVGYTGNRDAYLKIMNDVAHRRNLYKDIVRKYRRDTLNVSHCFLMARKLASRYELEQAVNLFNKVLALDTANKLGFHAECAFNIAEMEYTLTGNLKKMREFVDTGPKNSFAPKAYVYLINDLISKQDKAGCLAICENGLSKYPESWEILNKYAWAICSFKIQQQYPKALSMVQKSIALNPSRPGTYSTEAWIHFEMGDKENAIRLQKKAIEIFPGRSFVQDLRKFEEN